MRNFVPEMRRILILALLFLPFLSSLRVSAVEVSLSEEEQRLYDLMMQYRQEHHLPVIPLSASLTYVAQSHARDLQNYPPQDGCLLHSWSDQGNWTPLCYPAQPTEEQQKGMWNKPREMTMYPDAGYEIAYVHISAATAEGALSDWKSSPIHDAVMLNMGEWEGATWRAIGIGIYGHYAVVWFGEKKDKVQKK